MRLTDYVVIAAVGVGAPAILTEGCSSAPKESSASITEAIGPISSSEVPLDPTTVPKFAHDLLVPATWAPTPIVSGGQVIRNEYTLAVTQTTAQMLPPGFPASTVIAYRGAIETADGTTTVTVSPGAVFENVVGIPTRLHWQDDIEQPAFLQVDPTLHWANPNNIEEPVPPFQLFPPGYPLSLFPVAHVTHTHGLVVLPGEDGTAEEWFTNNNQVRGPSFVTSDYDMPNQQAPTQLFYHDHVMGVTRIGLYSGVVGTAYFIRDPANNPLDAASSPLPKGQFEIPLALTARRFYTDGNLDFPPDRGTLEAGGDSPPTQPYWSYNEAADEILVNGRVWPNLNVQPTQYRFRVLAGANAQLFDLQLCVGDWNANNGLVVVSDDGDSALCTGTVAPFTIIGSDGGYLPAPQTVTDVQIGITERADLVVDFSSFAPGTKITVINRVGHAGQPSGATELVMQFTVQSGTPHPPPTLSRSLFPPLPKLTPNAPTRIKVLRAFNDDDPLAPTFDKRSIDGLSFASPPSEYPLVGSTEEWDLVNAHDAIPGDSDLNTHQIHIHLLEFQVLNRQPFDNNAYVSQWALLNGHDPVTRQIVVDPAPFFTGPPIPPTPYETGWKDTVQTPGGFVTRILVRWAPQSVPAGGVTPGQNLFPIDPTSFPDPFTGPGYVWHCHLVGHEDHDMMRPLAVVNNWAPGKALKVGNVVAFNNVDYRVRQAHTTQSDWTPPAVPALFERVNNNDGTWQPQIIYAVNDRVLFQGKLYQVIQQHQAVVGWEPVNTPALFRPLPMTACSQLAQFCQGISSPVAAQCLADGQAGDNTVCAPELSECLSDCETTKARPCSGLCPNPVVITVPDGTTFHSGALGGGASCFQTVSRIASGTNAGFASPHQLTVNGRSEPLNGNWHVPLPPMRNDGYCIQVTGDTANPGASFSVQ
jgi:FtsP/CotA-like multicopper oxidase with cupredoxin domain